jgi:outer membrane lipoprotein-sorting protein
MTMTIRRPKWERSVEFKSWTLGTDFALTLITSPASESGQTFLKMKNDMWNWNPTINRLIKLPPSMMSQGWMGSDFSNDDILKESSIVVDYTHRLAGTEEIKGTACYKIILTPKENAAVVWGKMIKWISVASFDQLKTEYYDEDDALVKTETASEIRNMDDRLIPTYFEVIPADKPGNKTVVRLNSARFNVAIEEGFFSQQNMKKIR